MKQLILVGALAVAVAGTAAAQSSTAKPGQSRMPAASGEVKAAPDVPVAETILGLGAHSAHGDGRRQAAGRRHLSGATHGAGGQARPSWGRRLQYERWVEFVRAGRCAAGRSSASCRRRRLPAWPKTRRRGPAAQKSRCCMGNEYLRVWINRGGIHYLVHLVPA